MALCHRQGGCKRRRGANWGGFALRSSKGLFFGTSRGHGSLAPLSLVPRRPSRCVGRQPPPPIFNVAEPPYSVGPARWDPERWAPLTWLQHIIPAYRQGLGATRQGPGTRTTVPTPPCPSGARLQRRWRGCPEDTLHSTRALATPTTSAGSTDGTQPPSLAYPCPSSCPPCPPLATGCTVLVREPPLLDL